jgi:hypothetical protein
MPKGLRKLYTISDPVVQAAVTPVLLEHRDLVYRNYLETPIDL